MTVREISVSELHSRAPDALLDVRGPEEFAQGHMPGAVNVPLDRLAAVASRYAGNTVVTVCASGGRSVIAAQVLAAAGARAWSLAGGTRAWQQAGNPVARGTDGR